MEHACRPAIDFDDLASQQCLGVSDHLGELGPAQRLLAHGPPAGEARAGADDDPFGPDEPDQSGNG